MDEEPGSFLFLQNVGKFILQAPILFENLVYNILLLDFLCSFTRFVGSNFETVCQLHLFSLLVILRFGTMSLLFSNFGLAFFKRLDILLLQLLHFFVDCLEIINYILYLTARGFQFALKLFDLSLILRGCLLLLLCQ